MPRIAARQRFGLRDHALYLIACDQGTNGIVNENEFRILRNGAKRLSHGLLARIASGQDSNRPGEALGSDALFEEFDFVGASGDQKLADRRTGGQPSQCEHHHRHAIEQAELFGRIGAHASAEACCGQYGDDRGHSSCAPRLVCRSSRARPKVQEFTPMRILEANLESLAAPHGSAPASGLSGIRHD